MKNFLMKLLICDTEIIFICLEVNINYERLFLKKKMVESDIFYRDPKKCFSPLKISLHDWGKFETIFVRRYKKGKVKVQQDNLALFRRKYGVAHEDENDNELKNYLSFCLSTHFF